MHRSHPLARAFALCALLAVAALAVAACGGGQSKHGGDASSASSASAVAYGSLPPVGTPSRGGTISVGQIAGQTPTYIFPILPGAATWSYTINLIQNLFLPLYNGPTGSRPTINYALSLASKPVYSDGGKTVTITMKRGYRWADGKPVDADDMVFEIDLLKAAVAESPANWGQYTPGQFPASVVSVSAPSTYTLVIKLNRAYNPGYFLNNQIQDTNNVYPLPSTAWNIDRLGGPHLDYTNPANAKKIYDFLNEQGKSIQTFASSPLWKDVDGPYRLKSFSVADGSYVLAPNPTYGGGPGPYATIDVNTYPSVTAQLQALRSRTLDIANVDFSQLGAVPRLRSLGYSVFGDPQFGWFGAIINFKDTTGHFDKIIAQPYVRQALAHLIDQPAYVRGIFKNAAVPNYGPVPSEPSNPYTPSDNSSADGPYPFSPSTAVSLLRSHGWKVVPGGQTTCQKAGSGPGRCGAGIPAGTPFRFSWFDEPESQSPSSALEGEAFASEARQAAGIDVVLGTKTFNYMIGNYDDADPGAASNKNDWAVANFGGFFVDYYPTSEGIFNSGGIFNTGGFSDPKADRLMNASVFGSDPDAVTAEAAYLTHNYPVFFMPQSDYIVAVSSRVGGSADGFGSLTQQSLFPQYWYLTTRHR